jgi:trk system potassium uptake protein TrkH
VAGGISFVFYRQFFQENRQGLFHDTQTRAFLVICPAAMLLTAFFLWFENGFQWSTALLQGGFNALSAQTTAGFSSMDISQVGAGGKFILVLSMLSGGCLGSTAGGIKILRLLILMHFFRLLIMKTAAPKHAVSHIRIGGKPLETEELLNALSVLLLYILVTALSILPFLAMGYDPMNSFFEVASAIGTAGLSTGITGPDLHPFLKGVLCADMLMGRLEIVAWIVVLAPRTWIGQRMEE